MASEELFQNDYSEEPELEQDVEQLAERDERENEVEKEKGKTNGSTVTNEETRHTATNGNKAAEQDHEAKLTQLPMGRVRNIMRLDPDLQIASNEAVFAVTRAVELFIESLARESFTYTVQAKKKTMQKRDVDMAISAVDSLLFLDGALNF
ncbi:Mes4 [Drosophila busckii]|uniref:Mes4 n=1 Tax=Drosophila busckii TaxID=30019 RepID=A0A0M4EAS9_DROBS|nr:DNA polymerase epsilon subunit 4 [Drosophila busckii]ALC40515.1 Mes4 [Drosophila busckii]